MLLLLLLLDVWRWWCCQGPPYFVLSLDFVSQRPSRIQHVGSFLWSRLLYHMACVTSQLAVAVLGS